MCKIPHRLQHIIIIFDLDLPKMALTLVNSHPPDSTFTAELGIFHRVLGTTLMTELSGTVGTFC